MFAFTHSIFQVSIRFEFPTQVFVGLDISNEKITVPKYSFDDTQKKIT